MLKDAFREKREKTRNVTKNKKRGILVKRKRKF